MIQLQGGGILLPTIQKNLAITAISQTILLKNVLFIPIIVKLMLIRPRLVLLSLVLLQLVINMFLLQRWFNIIMSAFSTLGLQGNDTTASQSWLVNYVTSNHMTI